MVRAMQIKVYDSDKKLIIVGDLLESTLLQTQKDVFGLEITLFNTFCPIQIEQFPIDEDCPVYL